MIQRGPKRTQKRKPPLPPRAPPPSNTRDAHINCQPADRREKERPSPPPPRPLPAPSTPPPRPLPTASPPRPARRNGRPSHWEGLQWCTVAFRVPTRARPAERLLCIHTSVPNASRTPAAAPALNGPARCVPARWLPPAAVCPPPPRARGHGPPPAAEDGRPPPPPRAPCSAARAARNLEATSVWG